MTRAPFVAGKASEAFQRSAEMQDTTIGWRFINPLMKAQYGVDAMPETAENVAEDYQVSRADQDAFALRSQQRARAAAAAGFFAQEIVPVEVKGGKAGPVVTATDEHPRPDTTLEALAKLKPIVRNPGTVTAGNASGINDGAAAMILASEEAARRHGLTPRARILGMASAGVAPRVMGIGPVPATRKLMALLSLKIGDFDLIEINEAFASQGLACLRQLGVADDAEHVNPHGGAIALGHPLGMSGARLALTAVHGLEKARGGKRALVTMCVGVGQGVSLALERSAGERSRGRKPKERALVPMSAGSIPFHPDPSKPRYRPPAGAVDAHCHVFGPESSFPYAPERKYTPCDAPKEKLFALRDFLGLERNVIVQASCHSKDNRAMVDALDASNGKAKGVAFVGEEVSDDELKWMDKAGVRGVRFNFLKRLVDFTPRDVLQRIAARVDKLGWHIVVYFEMPDLPELEDFFTALPTTVVVDHMGTPDVKKGVDHPENQRFHKLMDRHKNFWVKATCPERMSVAGPPYDDVVPFGRALVERFPDRVIWGTDWPHPNMKKEAPDDGVLVDHIPKIGNAPTAALQQALLVDNPMRLYWG